MSERRLPEGYSPYVEIFGITSKMQLREIEPSDKNEGGAYTIKRLLAALKAYKGEDISKLGFYAEATYSYYTDTKGIRRATNRKICLKKYRHEAIRIPLNYNARQKLMSSIGIEYVIIDPDTGDKYETADAWRSAVSKKASQAKWRAKQKAAGDSDKSDEND